MPFYSSGGSPDKRNPEEFIEHATTMPILDRPRFP